MRKRCTTDGLTQAPDSTSPAGCGSGALTITKAHSVRLRKHMTSVRCLRHLPPTETGALFYITIPITATTTAAAIVVNHQSISVNHRRACASWLRTRRRRGMRADTHAHDARTNKHRWINAHRNANSPCGRNSCSRKARHSAPPKGSIRQSSSRVPLFHTD